MAVLVTNPAIEISGVAAIFSEKVAVKVTTPEVIILSESLDESVSVAFEVGEGQVPQTGLFIDVNPELLEKLFGSDVILVTHQPLMS